MVAVGSLDIENKLYGLPNAITHSPLFTLSEFPKTFFVISIVFFNPN